MQSGTLSSVPISVGSHLRADCELVRVSGGITGPSDPCGHPHIAGIQHHEVSGLEVIERIRGCLKQVAADQLIYLWQKAVGPVPVLRIGVHFKFLRSAAPQRLQKCSWPHGLNGWSW